MSARWLLASLVLAASAAPAAAAAMCGRPEATIVDRLIAMQSGPAEALHRDSQLFLFRDATDATYWVFTIKSTSAHPAVACSRALTEGSEARIETGLDCTAGEAACQSFLAQAMGLMDKYRAKP